MFSTQNIHRRAIFKTDHEAKQQTVWAIRYTALEPLKKSLISCFKGKMCVSEQFNAGLPPMITIFRDETVDFLLFKRRQRIAEVRWGS
jgi:hypothetical protein